MRSITFAIIATVLSLAPVWGQTVAIPAQQVSATSAFFFRQTKDKLDDWDKYTVGTGGDNGGLLQWECGTKPAPKGGFLMTFRVTYVFNKFFTGERISSSPGSHPEVALEYRFPPKTKSGPVVWNLEAHNAIAFYAQDLAWFTDDALATDKVLLRVTDRGPSVIDEFSMVGLSEALQKLPCYTPEVMQMARGRR